jgi:S1-C subfamily serine protease
MLRLIFLVALWSCVVSTAAPPDEAHAHDEPALDGTALYDHVRSTSVEILIAGRQDGSGWFASDDGLVVTAAHVVWGHVGRKGDGHRVEVISPKLGRLDAEIIAVDRGHDLALLQAKVGDAKPTFLQIAEKMPPPATEVFLFGAAYYRHDLLIQGSVARAEPTFEYFAGEGCYVQVYHVSAPSPPGTSGGCWVDRRGQIVGNQSGFITIEHAGAGIALVATPESIKKLVTERKSAQTPSLECGLEELWSQPAGYIARYPHATSGLVAVLLRNDGAAERAGLGDSTLIVGIEGKPVARRDELLAVLIGKRPSEKIILQVLAPDGGSSRDVEITLGMLEKRVATTEPSTTRKSTAGGNH